MWVWVCLWVFLYVLAAHGRLHLENTCPMASCYTHRYWPCRQDCLALSRAYANTAPPSALPPLQRCCSALCDLWELVQCETEYVCVCRCAVCVPFQCSTLSHLIVNTCTYKLLICCAPYIFVYCEWAVLSYVWHSLVGCNTQCHYYITTYVCMYSLYLYHSAMVAQY